MTRSRRRTPRLESLEPLVVMSISAAVMPHTLAFSEYAHRHPKLALTGQVMGTWQSVMTNPDIGKGETLIGWGTIAPLGPTQVSGTLRSPGFIASGRTTGSLTLTGVTGSVTLTLRGLNQKGFSGAATNYSYTLSGTGGYAGATGKGTAILIEMGGSFTLTIRH
jgi:hypothetical protein